jgi:hypothetical protein
MRLPTHLLFLLLVAGIAAAAVAAAPPAAGDKILQIAEAEAAELARLEAELAATTDPGAVLALQRCVTHVKLASRLALHEIQLAATADDDLRARLEILTEDLRDRLQHLEPDLPAQYAFDPLTPAAQEVQPCAE